jgi:D-alanine-D-alanine ligase
LSISIVPPRITDPAAFGRVAVLMGGTSSEREVSLDSGRNVLEALQSKGVDAFAVDGIPALIDAIRDGRVDRVFNILHGNKGGGEDGVLQGLLEALRVPYTGSGVLGSALSMDKIRTKQVWLSLGLPTPRYVRLAKGDDVHAAARDLGLPVIVKPSCEGSSVGVSRVHDDAGLDEAVELAARYPGEMLMEQLVVGDELTVAVIANGDDVTALPSIRIVPKGEWYDYNAKYIAEDTQYWCPGLEGEAEAEIRRLAADAFTSAFILLQLGSHAEFRRAVHLEDAVDWFAANAKAMDPDAQKLWERAAVRCRVLVDRHNVRSLWIAAADRPAA